MAVIVGIHGIAHTYEGEFPVANRWRDSISSGLSLLGRSALEHDRFSLAFYGDLFRPEGERGDALLTADDLSEEEAELVLLLWQEAARLAAENARGQDPKGEDPTLEGPDFTGGRARVPKLVQAALLQLSKSRFLKGIGVQRVVLNGLRQVGLFLEDASIKAKVLERARAKIGDDTKILIGHSLGSVVAYEALCANSANVETLITLGCPLGIPGVVFDRLTPRPVGKTGAWPGGVKRWINIADAGDIVALRKTLSGLFAAPADATLQDLPVHNGWESHSAERYLNSRQMGEVLAQALG